MIRRLKLSSAAEPPVTSRDQRMNCSPLEQLQNAESALQVEVLALQTAKYRSDNSERPLLISASVNGYVSVGLDGEVGGAQACRCRGAWALASGRARVSLSVDAASALIRAAIAG